MLFPRRFTQILQDFRIAFLGNTFEKYNFALLNICLSSLQFFFYLTIMFYFVYLGNRMNAQKQKGMLFLLKAKYCRYMKEAMEYLMSTPSAFE